MSERPQAIFVLVYLGLLALLGANLAVAHLQLGVWNPVLILGIAAGMAFLIVWFQMEVRAGSPLVRLFAFAALFWLAILFGLSITDWLTRPGGGGPLY
jgi:cytochrome c oxidase subunit IV